MRVAAENGSPKQIRKSVANQIEAELFQAYHDTRAGGRDNGSNKRGGEVCAARRH